MFQVSENDTFWQKVNRRIWSEIRKRLKGRLYLFSYKSYWHYLCNKETNNANFSIFYYTAQPNQGAGIGHQIANWVAGYHYAKCFGLKFTHLPFSTNSWDDFLGFGNKEIKVMDLLKKGYKLVRLPLFHFNNKKEIELNKKIISSYKSYKKNIFIASQDQYLKDQQLEISALQNKFFGAPSRDNDKLIYNKDNFNIAVHVRRGDIMVDPKNTMLTMRYLCNDYYYKVLKQVVECIRVEKPVHIYFFSQGSSSDYQEFKSFENLHWCFDMTAQDSFLHFVYSDLLITSKSSFSYKPALINRGIKICPRIFWHGYPDEKNWILCENDGTFDNAQLISNFASQ